MEAINDKAKIIIEIKDGNWINHFSKIENDARRFMPIRECPFINSSFNSCQIMINELIKAKINKYGVLKYNQQVSNEELDACDCKNELCPIKTGVIIKLQEEK